MIGRERGLLDTSVVIGPVIGSADWLPTVSLISSLTLAELASGPHATQDPAERAARQYRLQQVESTFDPIPFDAAAARAFGSVYAATLAIGRQPRGRIVDLQIAAVAMAQGLPLFTRNPVDLRGLESLVEIVAVA